MSNTHAKLESCHLDAIKFKLEQVYADHMEHMMKYYGQSDALARAIDDAIQEAARLSVAAMDAYNQNT